MCIRDRLLAEGNTQKPMGSKDITFILQSQPDVRRVRSEDSRCVTGLTFNLNVRVCTTFLL